MAKALLVDVLLGLAVAVELVCCIGLVAMPNLLDRLHFLTPAASLGPVLVAGAVVAKEALDHQGIVAVVVAVLLSVSGPVVGHATARADRVRRDGDWRLGPSESARRP